VFGVWRMVFSVWRSIEMPPALSLNVKLVAWQLVCDILRLAFAI